MEAAMDAKAALFGRELAALKSIDDYLVGADYWKDETIRLFRGLGLVRPTANASC
jgi:hypothetical protein